jgi:hypothetical protein
MATIVPGLFGKSSADVAAETQKRIDDFLNVSRQRTGPGSGRRQLGASSGVFLGQLAKGLFGIKNAEETKAIQNEDMAKYYNQVADEETRRDPYKATSLAAEVAEKFGRDEDAIKLRAEAYRVGEDQKLKTLDLGIKQNQLQTSDLEVKNAKLEEASRFVRGALVQIENNKDPEKVAAITSTVLTQLSKMGSKDAEMAMELPQDQKINFLKAQVEMAQSTKDDINEQLKSSQIANTLLKINQTNTLNNNELERKKQKDKNDVRIRDARTAILKETAANKTAENKKDALKFFDTKIKDIHKDNSFLNSQVNTLLQERTNIESLRSLLPEDERTARLNKIASDIRMLQDEIDTNNTDLNSYQDRYTKLGELTYGDKLPPKETTTTPPNEKTYSAGSSFMYTDKATPDVKAQYSEFMSKEKDVNKRRKAQAYAIEQGWVKPKE